MAPKTPKAPRRKPSKDEEALHTTPIYRRESPTLGVGGTQEIYRQGDRGFVVEVDQRGVAGSPYCTIRPVRFLGIEVTSYIQTGPDESLPDQEALHTKLMKEFA